MNAYVLTVLCAVGGLILGATGAHAAEPKPAPEAPLLETSLYHLDDPWTDQAKATRRLREWRGAPVVVAMIFSRCQYSCPVIIKRLQDLDAKLTAAERGRVRVLLITLDPTHDTPAVLAAFAEKRGIDLTRWTLLNGGEAQVRTLSIALNDRFKATGKGEFSHGSGLTVLDAQGRIAYQGKDQAQALAAVRKP